MCAAAIAWAGVKEVVWGVRSEDLRGWGWPQFEVGAEELWRRRGGIGGRGEVRGVGGVEVERIGREGWFGWQFDGEGACPRGCGREKEDGDIDGGKTVGMCRPIKN